MFRSRPRASDRGAITGLITDNSGAAVPNVAIDAVNTATNARFETLTTNTGSYRLVSLPIGIYDVTAKASGFNAAVQRGVQIQTNQTATIDIGLTVGAVTDSVTVQGGVPLIQTESADVGMVVESKQFLDMPLTLGGGIRNASSFIRLSPGVSPTGTWTKSISGGGGFQDQIYYDGIALSRETFPMTRKSTPLSMRSANSNSLQTTIPPNTRTPWAASPASQ